MELGEACPDLEKCGLNSVTPEGVLGLGSGGQEVGDTGMMTRNMSQGNRMPECTSGQPNALKPLGLSRRRCTELKEQGVE